MSAPEMTTGSGDGEASASDLIDSIAGFAAVIGGLLALAVAMLATTSVALRWLFNAPIDGDFEYVKMATAVAVFAYLPYTQARRGNIMIDTFTGWLPLRVRAAIDAMWDLAYAGLIGYLTYALSHGTLSAIASGETTMQRQIVIWPSIALCTALAALVVVTALSTAIRLVRASSGRRAS